MISFKNSIAFRTFVISFILLSVPLLVDSFIVLQARYLESVKTARQFLLEESSSLVYQLSRLFQIRGPTMLYIIESLKLQENFPDTQSKELDAKLSQVAEKGLFSDVVLLKSNENGEFTVVASSFQNRSQSEVSSFPFYEHLAKREYTKGTFSSLVKTPDHKYYFLFGSTIYDQKNYKVLGTIFFTTDITSSLTQLMQRAEHTHYKFSFGILDDSMEVVAASEDDLLGQRFLQVLNPAEAPQTSLQTEPKTISYIQGHPFFEFEWQNQDEVALLNLIPNTNFFLLSYMSQNEIQMFPLLNFLEFYAIYTLLLVVGGSIAYLLVKRISRPFFQLSSVMESLSKGDLDKRYVPDPFGFEINTLGGTFNDMINTLIDKKKQAEEEHVKSEIYEKELRIGQQVQRSLLPEKMPHVRGVKIAARYIPAKEVGGDFYDVFERSLEGKNEIVFAVADASGKGVHACFYSLGVRSSLRTFSREYRDLSSVMKSTNLLFCEDSGDTGMFVTLLAGVLDPLTKTFSYCSLGHNPAILRHEDGSVHWLQERTMPAGVTEEIDPKQVTIQLAEKDLLVFYTDGLTEAHNTKGELFTEQRLIDFISAKGHLEVNALAEELINEVRKFEGGALQHDDITLLIVKLEKENA